VQNVAKSQLLKTSSIFHKAVDEQHVNGGDTTNLKWLDLSFSREVSNISRLLQMAKLCQQVCGTRMTGVI
jgi:hypothetical protein